MKTGDVGAWERGSLGTREPGNTGAWGRGSLGTREPGDAGAWELKLLMLCVLKCTHVSP